ncbi:MAG: S8 family serine peptidase [Flavobacteriales bacterium]|nr:S8 family serine peptidase [Flavobacteriales bacterium]
MKQIFTILWALLFSTAMFAQERPQIVPGNLIVQVPNAKIEDVIAENQFFNGQPTGLKLNRLLSSPMAAYLLEFDPNIHHEQFLQQVWNHPGVSLIQLNHYIQNRNTTPDDPQLNQQWWHINTGQNGGTPDADIDSDEAWDITTGGVTATGDTIVACVVDDGGALSHPDLMANNWVNYHEIPNNDLDDDGNGYIDDYLGWNPVDHDDNVDGGSHGVNVAGMIGAVGNNGTGVVGVNWNVKIMNTTYGDIGNTNNPNEANVIEAYTYPLVMRRLYEQTSGAKGAYVVVTNSSWGIDNADPADAPLWCAFYDTLGMSGILSTGATANNNVNIDNVGDLPTACSSEYLIAVTATDDQDVRTFSGYGQTTIDLGAPGDNVRTTASNGTYQTTSGTSFASPATAGAVALAYSAPCASLAAISHSDPAFAAQMVRDAILNGVDPVSNLATECVTGGRLNVRGALDEILNNCSSGGCIAPFTLMASGISDTLATISWNSLADIDSFNISFAEIGGSVTDIANLPQNSFNLTNLTACTDYWFVAQSICDGVAGDWSDTLFFETDGCCVPPTGFQLGNLTDTSVTATWTSVLAAESYLIQWREAGNSTWNDMDGITSTTYTIADLAPCTEYQVRIATNCSGDSTVFSATQTLSTFGCGACIDNAYCASSGSTDYEWIGSIEVGDLSNSSSGSANGYEDFTNMSATLQRGDSIDFTFTPDFAGQAYTEHFRVWIDADQNGAFDNSELLVDDIPGSQSAVSGTITIPSNAVLGSTRMRVSMAYGTGGFGAYPQTACQEGQDGEVEDYCVNIIDTISGISEAATTFGMKVYPIPARTQLTVELQNPVFAQTNLEIVDAMGRIAMLATSSENRTIIDISQLSEGIYLLRAVDVHGQIIGMSRFVK